MPLRDCHGTRGCDRLTQLRNSSLTSGGPTRGRRGQSYRGAWGGTKTSGGQFRKLSQSSGALEALNGRDSRPFRGMGKLRPGRSQAMPSWREDSSAEGGLEHELVSSRKTRLAERIRKMRSMLRAPPQGLPVMLTLAYPGGGGREREGVPNWGPDRLMRNVFPRWAEKSHKVPGVEKFVGPSEERKRRASAARRCTSLAITLRNTPERGGRPRHGAYQSLRFQRPVEQTPLRGRGRDSGDDGTINILKFPARRPGAPDLSTGGGPGGASTRQKQDESGVRVHNTFRPDIAAEESYGAEPAPRTGDKTPRWKLIKARASTRLEETGSSGPESGKKSLYDLRKGEVGPGGIRFSSIKVLQTLYPRQGTPGRSTDGPGQQTSSTEDLVRLHPGIFALQGTKKNSKVRTSPRARVRSVFRAETGHRASARIVLCGRNSFPRHDPNCPAISRAANATPSGRISSSAEVPSHSRRRSPCLSARPGGRAGRMDAISRPFALAHKPTSESPRHV